MREIEEDIGAILVLRETTGITFTDAGRALLVHARLVVGQLERAREEMATLVGASQAVLRIGIASWIAMSCLGEVVKLFQQRMPAVRLELFEAVLTVSIPKLRDGTLDFCIGRSAPAHLHDEFSHAPLFRTSSAVVARRGHPLAGSRSLSELRDAQWVLNWAVTHDPEMELDPQDPFQRYLHEFRPRVHVAHSFVIAASLVRDTDMLALMAWPLVETIAAREGFCTLPSNETLNDTAYSLITRRGAPLSAAAKCFMACFTAAIQRASHSASPSERRIFHSMDALSFEEQPPDAWADHLPQ
jgi:DNA-binding transcriptional LysR family regulator